VNTAAQLLQFLHQLMQCNDVPTQQKSVRLLIRILPFAETNEIFYPLCGQIMSTAMTILSKLSSARLSNLSQFENDSMRLIQLIYCSFGKQSQIPHQLMSEIPNITQNELHSLQLIPD